MAKRKKAKLPSNVRDINGTLMVEDEDGNLTKWEPNKVAEAAPDATPAEQAEARIANENAYNDMLDRANVTEQDKTMKELSNKSGKAGYKEGEEIAENLANKPGWLLKAENGAKLGWNTLKNGLKNQFDNDPNTGWKSGYNDALNQLHEDQIKQQNAITAYNDTKAGNVTYDNQEGMDLSRELKKNQDEAEINLLKENPDATPEEIRDVRAEEDKKQSEALKAADEAQANIPQPQITTTSQIPEPPEPENYDDIYKQIYNDYRQPKNGAEYLKGLWSQGLGGKAQAFGNVLGNILGAGGAGLAGKDYTSDWQQYKDNYINQMAERNQRIFNDNMDLVKQAKTNEVARDNILKNLDMAISKGMKLSPTEQLAARNFRNATGQTPWMEQAITSILTKALDFLGIGGF